MSSPEASHGPVAAAATTAATSSPEALQGPTPASTLAQTASAAVTSAPVAPATPSQAPSAAATSAPVVTSTPSQQPASAAAAPTSASAAATPSQASPTKRKSGAATEKGKGKVKQLDEETTTALVTNEAKATQTRTAVRDLLANAYLGLFNVEITLDENRDRLEVEDVGPQRKTDYHEHGEWLEAKVAEAGRTTRFLPLKIAVEPENLTAAFNQRFKDRTTSELTPAAYAAAMRTGDEARQGEARRSYVLAVAGMAIYAELKPHVGAGPVPFSHTFRVLDGQKRIAVLRHLQAKVPDTMKGPFSYAEAELYDWRQLKDSPEAKLELINQEPIRQNESLASDAMKRFLSLYLLDLVTKHNMRTRDLVHPVPTRTVTSGRGGKATEGGGAKSEKGGKRVRDKLTRSGAIASTDRALRAVTMTALQTAAGHDMWEADPLVQTLDSHVPEIAVFHQALWSYQQRLISTILRTQDDGGVEVAYVPQLIMTSVLTIIAGLPLPPRGLSRTEIIKKTVAALDAYFSYSDDVGGDERDMDAGTEEDRDILASKWYKLGFGTVRNYLLVRGQVLYALFGPHTDRYLDRPLSGESSPWVPTMMPAGLWNGPDDKALEAAHLRFLREHYVSAPSSSPSSSKLGAFTMPAAPDIMHRLYRKPAMKALTHDVFTCFGELASMVDPLYVLTVTSQQVAAVDAPIGMTPGFGPYFAADDRRYSVFKPFWGALLASVGRPQPTDDRYTSEAGPEPKVEVAEQACKVIGPLMEELFAYVVHNAAEMAAELQSARGQAKTIAEVLQAAHYGKKRETVKKDGLNMELFYDRCMQDFENPVSWGQPEGPHTQFWAFVLARKSALYLESKEKKRNKAVASDVQRHQPSKDHVIMLMQHTLARVYLVYQSRHWCRIRILLNSLEIAANFFGVRNAGEKVGAEAVKGVPSAWPGHFGDYRSAVPMVTQLNEKGPKAGLPTPTFRLRDRALLAAWIPRVVGPPRQKRQMELRLAEATVFRLWEPTVTDYEEVILTSRKREHGRIALLPMDYSAKSKLVRDPDAVCLPSRSRVHLTQTANALHISLPNDSGVESDFRGSQAISAWHMRQGKEWGKYNFGGMTGEDKTDLLPEDLGDPSFLSQLRVVDSGLKGLCDDPNFQALHKHIVELVPGPAKKRLGLVPRATLVRPRTANLEKVMLWEGLGVSSDHIEGPVENALQDEGLFGADFLSCGPFLPLSPPQIAGSFLAYTTRRAPGCEAAVQALKDLTDLDARMPADAPTVSNAPTPATVLEQLQKKVEQTFAKYPIMMKSNDDGIDPPTIAQPTLADSQEFPGAKSQQSAHVAREAQKFLAPFWKKIKHDGTKSTAPTRALPPATDVDLETAVINFYNPLFRPANWTAGFGIAWRRSGYRYFTGFNPDFAWHLPPHGQQESGWEIAPPFGYHGWDEPSSPSSIVPARRSSSFYNAASLSFELTDNTLNHDYVGVEEVYPPTGEHEVPADEPSQAMGRMYGRVMVVEPNSHAFSIMGSVQAINVQSREGKTPLKDIDGDGTPRLAPQPLVYAWGLKHKLWPEWLQTSFYPATIPRASQSSRAPANPLGVMDLPRVGPAPAEIATAWGLT
ncbi:hypothetical protein CF319_g8291 [Tilletia indica]|nr:hypothetical protein CF319_g8291 [Tilletia indica]